MKNDHTVCTKVVLKVEVKVIVMIFSAFWIFMEPISLKATVPKAFEKCNLNSPSYCPGDNRYRSQAVWLIIIKLVYTTPKVDMDVECARNFETVITHELIANCNE